LFFQFVDESVQRAVDFPDVERSNGIEFERACLDALVDLGWKARLTKASGDQGVDIVAQKQSRVVAIQCKHYKSPAGNSAVQEVFSGKSFYEADAAAVVCPAGFTGSAVQLAQKLGVLLVDPSALDVLDELVMPS
jgi:HJR/Mrr/RecB family endonuclease